IPGGAPPSGGFPIVAFGPGFGGIGDDCAYSIHPEWGYEELLGALVDDGFVVASTDWEGHGTPLPYMDSVAESATHSLLDGARAAIDLLGPAASDQVLIVGHSLGGVAAAQSLLHGPAYDEGLDIRGVVSMEGVGDFETLGDGAPGPDDVGVLDTMRNARSWSFGYPELRPQDVLTTEGMELLSRIDEDGTCDEVFWLELNGKPLHEIPVLEVTTIDWMTVDSWAARIRAQTVTAAPYPVFYAMAEGPLAAHVRDVADRLCEGADHIEYRAYATDHDGVVDMAYRDYRTWLQERLSGDGSFDGCDF
ncbi:MAG TPA: alpha/beta fold hydrolase, partial [Candidatus Limnocylindria bacterium]|nr:alpha/beta fold hydrolase [Candidatus Limnocylindria bacterium]